MTEPGDRVPTPPGQPPTDGPIAPVPTPIRWQVQKVGHVNNGEPLLIVKFWLITGEVVLFMPASAASRLADQLFTEASGLHLAGPSSLS